MYIVVKRRPNARRGAIRSIVCFDNAYGFLQGSFAVLELAYIILAFGNALIISFIEILRQYKTKTYTEVDLYTFIKYKYVIVENYDCFPLH